MDRFDWTVISVTFYVVTALAVGRYAFIKRRASIFEPIGQYLVFLSLFTLPLPIRTLFTLEVDGSVTPFLPQILGWLPVSVLLSTISIPLFAVGYYGGAARHLGRLLPRFDPVPKNLDFSRFTFIFISCISILLIYKLTQESGGLLAFLLLGYGSTAETFGRGYLAVGFPWLFVASLFLLYRYAQYRRRLDMLVFIAALIGIIMIQLVTGNRAMLLYILITVFCFVDQCIHRFRLTPLIVIGLTGFLFFNLVGLTRTSNYDNYGEFVERSLSSTDSVTVGGSDGLFYTLSIGQFVVPFETLPQVVRTTGISETPWFGRSFVAAPFYLIPSFVWPDRPQSIANWYMSKFYGEGDKLNEGRAFFFLSEGYLNFGPAGVILLALFWGWLWGGINQWMLNSKKDPAAALIYALTTAYIFRCIAGDFSTLTAGVTQQSLSIAIVGLWLARSGRLLSIRFRAR